MQKNFCPDYMLFCTWVKKKKKTTQQKYDQRKYGLEKRKEETKIKIMRSRFCRKLSGDNGQKWELPHFW